MAASAAWLFDRQATHLRRGYGGQVRLPYSFIVCLFFYGIANARLKSRRGARIFFVAIGLPLRVARVSNLFHRALGLDGMVVEFFRRRLGVRACFQDQPLIFCIITPANPHEGPFAFSFFAIKNEVKLAVPQ